MLRILQRDESRPGDGAFGEGALPPFGTSVFTADGHYLGRAFCLQHRLEGADPALKLYPSYLQVQNLELGDMLYVPTAFVDGYDEEQGEVLLSVPLKTVLHEEWSRLPDFVLAGRNRKEALPAGERAPGRR